MNRIPAIRATARLTNDRPKLPADRSGRGGTRSLCRTDRFVSRGTDWRDRADKVGSTGLVFAERGLGYAGSVAMTCPMWWILNQHVWNTCTSNDKLFRIVAVSELRGLLVCVSEMGTLCSAVTHRLPPLVVGSDRWRTGCITG